MSDTEINRSQRADSTAIGRPTVLVVDLIRASYGGVERVMANVLPLLNRNFRVIFCDVLGNADYAASLRAAGIEVVHLAPPPRRNYVGGTGTIWRPFLVVMKLPWLLMSIIRLRKWIARNKPDLVYFNRLPMIRSFLPAVPQSMKCVYHAHGFRSPSEIRPAMVRTLNKRFIRVVAVSKVTRDQLATAGVQATKLTVVYNALDAESFRSSAWADGPALPNREPEDVVFCHVAVVAPHKAQDISIEAIKLSDVPTAKLWICGDIGAEPDAHYKTDLVRRVGELELSQRVVFLGWRTDVARVMAQADVIILPSRHDSESFGMVLVEGMALGKPCIGTTRGGVPEVIADGQTGLIRPPTAVDLAEAMRILARSTDTRLCMGEAAKERVADVFSLSRQASDLTAVLRGALAS